MFDESEVNMFPQINECLTYKEMITGDYLPLFATKLPAEEATLWLLLRQHGAITEIVLLVAKNCFLSVTWP